MDNGLSILIIEDELITREMTKEILQELGYHVLTAENGKIGSVMAKHHLPDLILLDLGLPDIDGLEVAKSLKSDKETAEISILVLSARDDEHTIISGLESFADDYITKPFNESMLIARVKALLRRVQKAEPDSVIEINDLQLNRLNLSVTTPTTIINLSKTEFDILFLLASRPNCIYSREQIIANINGDDASIMERAIDMNIVRLRKKLGDSAQYIKTVRGVGYQFLKA